MKSNFIKIVIALSSCMFAIIVCEVLLRVTTDDRYCIWAPHIKTYFIPADSIFPGIRDSSLFSTNSIGFRGEEFTYEECINIIAIGGSTTECLYLDQQEAWPSVLESMLNASGGQKYRVLNGGKSGLTSAHNALQVSMMLEQYPWIDVIVVLSGINDLQYALSLGGEYKRKDMTAIFAESFQSPPGRSNGNILQRSRLYGVVKNISTLLISNTIQQDQRGLSYAEWRNNRAHGAIVTTEPNLAPSLAEYASNIDSIIKISQVMNKKLIMLTQPVLWDADMPLSNKKLCWFGWIGESQANNTGMYYPESRLLQYMDAYNSILTDECEKYGIQYIDLAHMVKKDTTIFYDDCHFNEQGAVTVASIVAHNIAK